MHELASLLAASSLRHVILDSNTLIGAWESNEPAAFCENRSHIHDRAIKTWKAIGARHKLDQEAILESSSFQNGVYSLERTNAFSSNSSGHE